MALLDMIFGRDDEKYSSDINIVKKIFPHLGLLDKEEIESLLDENDDKEFFDRLDFNNNFKSVRYKFDVGYGSDKIDEVCSKLVSISHENNLTDDEVKALMVNYVNECLDEYKSLASSLIDSINKIDESDMNYADKVATIDATIDIFKRDKLGYSLNLGEEIERRVTSLKSLKYGGCGVITLRKFREECREAFTKLDGMGKNSREKVEYMDKSIYEPLVQRYNRDLGEVDALIEKLKSNKDLSSGEIEHKRQEIILNFNEHYGHSLDSDILIDDLCDRLKNIDKNGGYGTNIISKFRRDAGKIDVDQMFQNKSRLYTCASIRSLYESYRDRYLEKSKRLDKDIEDINNSSLDSFTKEKRISAIRAYFRRDNSIFEDSEEKIDYMTKVLGAVGYSSDEVDEFRKEASQTLRNNDSNKSLDSLYSRVLLDTHNANKSITDVLSIRLSNLNGGGYSDSAVNEFKKVSGNIERSAMDEDNKREKIMDLYDKYKNDYFSKRDVLYTWMDDRLNSYTGSDKEEYEKSIKAKVDTLTGLSMREFRAYLIVDDEEKKKEYGKHNLKVIEDYLLSKDDGDSYKKHKNDIERGVNPYSKEDMNEAYDILLKRKIVGEDNGLYTIDEYINSTLIRQIMDAQTGINKK